MLLRRELFSLDGFSGNDQLDLEIIVTSELLGRVQCWEQEVWKKSEEALGRILALILFSPSLAQFKTLGSDFEAFSINCIYFPALIDGIGNRIEPWK